MDKSILIIFLLFSLIGCQSSTDKVLQRVDTLMTQYPDSINRAYSLIKTIHPQQLSGKREKAFYALLYTQAQYKNYETIKSDSLIDIAVSYYERHPKGDQLTRSYLYKAAALNDMGVYKTAIEWYKKAEFVADSSDYFILGLINSSIGQLYQLNFISSDESIERYKKALKYYKLSKKNYETYMLSNIGQLYSMKTLDSAELYLRQALYSAEQFKDSASIINNWYLLAKAYIFHKQYDKAKQMLLSVIQNNGSKFIGDSPYYSISTLYARLGQVDSAKYFLNQIKYLRTSSDTMRYYMSCDEILKAIGDYKNAYKYSSKAQSIADSILTESRKNDIFITEKLFDNLAIKYNEEKLKAQLVINNYFIVISVLIAIIFISSTIILWRRKRRILLEKIRLIEQLQNEIKYQEDNTQRVLESKMEVITSLNKSLEEKNIIEQSLRGIIDDRMHIMRNIMSIKYEYKESPDIFFRQFHQIMMGNKKSRKECDNIISIANQLNNNIIDYISIKNPKLVYNDKLLLSLTCLLFSPIEMCAFLDSPSIKATYSMRYRLVNKLNAESLEEFINQSKLELGNILINR